MSVTIARPNGKLYRPRSIRCVTLVVGGEDEPPSSIVVLGTHELTDARARAERHMSDETTRMRDVFGGSLDYVYRLSEKPGKLVWRRRQLGGFYEDEPFYHFEDDPERGAAGVEFDIDEIDLIDDDAPDQWIILNFVGGYVCSACGDPVESEPCRKHQPRAYAACVGEVFLDPAMSPRRASDVPLWEDGEADA